jgi:hypothetical protein
VTAANHHDVEVSLFRIHHDRARASHVVVAPSLSEPPVPVKGVGFT